MPLPSLSPRVETIRPLGDKILARRLDDDTMDGAILLPADRAKIDLGRAKVLLVGPRVTICRPGDVLLLPRQLGYQKITYKGAVAHFIPQSAVHAVEPK